MQHIQGCCACHSQACMSNPNISPQSDYCYISLHCVAGSSSNTAQAGKSKQRANHLMYSNNSLVDWPCAPKSLNPCGKCHDTEADRRK